MKNAFVVRVGTARQKLSPRRKYQRSIYRAKIGFIISRFSKISVFTRLVRQSENIVIFAEHHNVVVFFKDVVRVERGI